jgi:hypothetical protein
MRHDFQFTKAHEDVVAVIVELVCEYEHDGRGEPDVKAQGTHLQLLCTCDFAQDLSAEWTTTFPKAVYIHLDPWSSNQDQKFAPKVRLPLHQRNLMRNA